MNRCRREDCCHKLQRTDVDTVEALRSQRLPSFPSDNVSKSMKTILFALLLTMLSLSVSHAATPGAPEPQYVYRAELVQVIDGNTVLLNIDLGFKVWLHDEKLRLDGVTAPDLKGDQKAEAQKWKTALEDLLAGKELIIETKKEKSGTWPGVRFLATIWANGEKVNEALAKAVK